MTTDVESIVSISKNKRNLKRQNAYQKIGYVVLWLCGLIAVAAVFWIIGYVLMQGLPSIILNF